MPQVYKVLSTDEGGAAASADDDEDADAVGNLCDAGDNGEDEANDDGNL